MDARLCRWRRGCAACVMLMGALVLAVSPVVGAEPDTCLIVSAENLAQGSGNFYLYAELSDRPYTIANGDVLEYDILLPAVNPLLVGGVDADVKNEDLPAVLGGRPWLRDCGFKDAAGLLLHGDAVLEPARDQWYHRAFDLSRAAGAQVVRWTVVFEGDQPGRYVQLLDNIRVTRAGQPVFTVYENGPPPALKIHICEGYSREVLIAAAPREDALSAGATEGLLAQARTENALRAAHAQLQVELGLVRAFGKLAGNQELLAAADQAAQAEDKAAFEAGNMDAYTESLKRAREPLLRFAPVMQGFTGHLVGHGHIDLQWLWGWDETVNQIIPATFGQAVKFMAEYPSFTFSQSSAALYVATEEHHPELFKQIQEYVQSGRWELVDGRWCESDSNMISPESHARQFLYAQRYFQQKFGRMCTEGFEPDTFGHPWTLPQILRKGGIRSYYFCRAGKGQPLFWWEGPDGSKVLAFDETATGGWYNDVVNDDKVRELAKFVETTGAHDHLMVYGVGNHGGGPTRENLDAAVAMRGRPVWPTIKFSTLTEFFERLYEQAPRLSLPTVRDELNSVFEGCYTSHSRIKKYNRDSEALLEGTEVFAALASLNGPAYPRAALDGLWRDVLWNHHHDTICGSFVHPSAEYSARIYDALLERGGEIRQQSCQALAKRIKLAGAGPHVVVFNSTAWPRTEVVEVTLPGGGDGLTLADEAGDVPTQVVPRAANGAAGVRVCFVARDVPGCGFKTFSVRPGKAGAPPAAGQTLVTPQFQILHEKPRDMSAWEIGEIDKTTDLAPSGVPETVEDGPVRRRVRSVYRYDQSTITQDTLTYPGDARMEFETTVEWGQVGQRGAGCDMLKVAFPTGITAERATYEIPFGDIARPNDGREHVALKWCDLSDAQHGVTVLNDCKHGYDVKDGIVRLTLLRSSYDPDPKPDVGTHHMRYAAVPHAGPLDKAATARAAWAFNRPLDVLVLETAPEGGTLPSRWSGCEATPANIIVTAVKCAEDNDDFIIRAYECAGQAATATITLGFEARSVIENDFLERAWKDAGKVAVAGRTITAEFKPYEIRTLRVGR